MSELQPAWGLVVAAVALQGPATCVPRDPGCWLCCRVYIPQSSKLDDDHTRVMDQEVDSLAVASTDAAVEASVVLSGRVRHLSKSAAVAECMYCNQYSSP